MGLFKSKFAIKKDYKLSEESALESLRELLEAYDFDIDGETNQETKQIKETIAESLLEYFRLGYLSLGDDGITIIQKLKRPPGDVQEIKYGEFKGENKMAMDKFKAEQIQSKAFALVGSVSGLGIDGIKQLKKYDCKVAEAVGMLFLL